MTTVSQFKTYINQYTRDPNNRIWSEAQKLRAINIAYTQVQKDLWWTANTSDAVSTGNTVANTATLAKPSDFVTLSVIKVGWQELYKTTRKDVQIQYDIMVAWKPDRYYISWSSIYLVPTPDAIYSYELYYQASEAVLSADSDESALDAVCDEAIVKFACYNLWQWLDGNKAQGARQDYEDQMNTVRYKLFNDDENSVFMSWRNNTVDWPKVVF